MSWLLFTILALPLSSAILGISFQNRVKNASPFICFSIFLTLIFVFYALYVIPLGSIFQIKILHIATLKFGLALLFDQLSVTMLLLVTFVSLMVHLYALRYLLSDSTQPRFMAQLSLVTFAVLFLVMSGNLLTAFVGWEFVGASLYILLNHYHYDVNANRAAKKKFIINRFGDMCFLLAVILAYQHFDTSSFVVLFSPDNGSQGMNTFILSLLFIAVMTKSAQFPFHFWLPDTMETPTPVSALMHAGIINSGGFLLARMAPWVIQSAGLMHVIFGVGFVTTLVGGFYMLSQPDVKRQLAYSTIGQMGYMIMQCGLGCFGAAVLHLIAHGFFKGSLFLHAGNALDIPVTLKKKKKASHRLPNAVLTVILTGFLMFMVLNYAVQSMHLSSLNTILVLFISMMTAQTLWLVINSGMQFREVLLSITLFSSGLLFYFFVMHHFELSLIPAVIENSKSVDTWQYALVVTLMVIQFMMWLSPTPKLTASKWGKKLYVMSLNKGTMERLFRRYFLYPYRDLGDWGHRIIQLNPKKYLNLPVVSILVGLLILMGEGTRHWVMGIDGSHTILYHINSLIFIVFLILANKLKSLRHFFTYTLITQVALVNLGFFTSDPLAVKAAAFHFINSLVLLSCMLLLIIQHYRKATPVVTIQRNTLPWISVYLGIIMMLLIGLPGTASFISDFLILHALVFVQPVSAGIFIISMILLAIAVLHTLQVYIFSPAKFSRLNPKLSIPTHLFCQGCILFNVWNGISPSGLFDGISQLRALL